MNQEIISLLDNREFANKMAKLNYRKDIKKLFNEYGVDINDEELSSVLKFKKEIEKDLSTLDDGELEEIGSGFEPLTAIKFFDSLAGICTTISGIVQGYANFKLSDTKMKCDNKVELAKIKNDGKLLRAKISATDHIVGYALIAAIAVAFIRKRKRKIET